MKCQTFRVARYLLRTEMNFFSQAPIMRLSSAFNQLIRRFITGTWRLIELWSTTSPVFIDQPNKIVVTFQVERRSEEFRRENLNVKTRSTPCSTMK